MSSNLIPVLLGLAAAITWGAADFAGGLATRRAAPSRVVLIAHGVSLLLLAAVSWRMPVVTSPWAIAGGLLSGVAGGAALMLFYKALSLGAMGLAAAVAGLMTTVLPVLLTVYRQGLPPLPQLAGFAVAAAAILLIAYAPAAPSRAAPPRLAMVLATLAGTGFGLQLVWLHSSAAAGAPAAGSPAYAPVVRALLFSRVGGTAIALCAQLAAGMRPGMRAALVSADINPVPPPRRMPLPVLAALAGLLDTAGNGLYMLASLSGRLDVAAVLSSLYPGATIVLAMLFLHERATRLQALGMGFALAAVALIAA